MQVVHPVKCEFFASEHLHWSADLCFGRISFFVRDAEEVKAESFDVCILELILRQVVHCLVQSLALELQCRGQFLLFGILEYARDVHTIHSLLQFLDEVGGMRLGAEELLELHVAELLLEPLNDRHVLSMVLDETQDLVAASFIFTFLVS